MEESEKRAERTRWRAERQRRVRTTKARLKTLYHDESEEWKRSSKRAVAADGPLGFYGSRAARSKCAAAAGAGAATCAAARGRRVARCRAASPAPAYRPITGVSAPQFPAGDRT